MAFTLKGISSTAAVVCLLAMLAGTGSVPIPSPTVDNPCRVDPSANLTFLPLRDQLLSTFTEINAAADVFKSVADQIAAAGLTPSEVTSLRTATVPGLPVKLNTTGSVDPAAMTTVLSQDYTNTSTYIMYVKVAISEQATNDNGRLVPELKSAEAAFFAILCKNDMLLRSLNSRVTTFVNASVVPAKIQNLDGKKTYMRNYILMNQSRSYAVAMATYYQKLYDAVPMGR